MNPPPAVVSRKLNAVVVSPIFVKLDQEFSGHRSR